MMNLSSNKFSKNSLDTKLNICLIRLVIGVQKEHLMMAKEFVKFSKKICLSTNMSCTHKTHSCLNAPYWYLMRPSFK